MATIVSIVLALNIFLVECVLIYALNRRKVKKAIKKGGPNNK